MVANHSRKAKARFLMGLRSSLTFTEAMDEIARIEESDEGRPYTVGEAIDAGLMLGHLGNTQHTIHLDSMRLAALAARALSSSRDLVIYGSTGSGKSTILDSVIDAFGGTAKIFQDNGFYGAGFGSILRSFGAVSKVPSLLALDERVGELEYELFVRREFEGKLPRVIVTHGMDLEGAQRRMEIDFPALKLRNPLYLETVRNRESGERSAKLHDPLTSIKAAGVIERARAEELSAGIVAQEVPDPLAEGTAALQSKRDLVIYGPQGGHHRTLLLDQILEETDLRTMLVSSGSKPLRRQYISQTFAHGREILTTSDRFDRLNRESVEVLAVDELCEDMGLVAEPLIRSPRRVLVVAAESAERAAASIRSMLPTVELTDPVFVHPDYPLS